MRTLVAALAAPLLTCVLAACPPPAPTGEPDPSPTVDGGDDVDAGPVFAACESNADCAGGEVCRDDECRTACQDDSECTGDYAVCSVDDGICVECIDDTTCDDDERCVDQACAFFCSADDQCASGEFCREEEGTCHAIECEENADCSGGFRCDDFTCVSIDDIVCEANTQSCDGDVRVECNADGTEATRTPCGDDERCVVDEGIAQCRAQVCTPNSLGCIDDATAFACNADGTSQDALPCGDNAYCTDGVCRDQVCTPDAVTCDGNELVVCNANGSSAERTSCLDASLCTGDAGCQCTPGASGATCEERVCVPGAGQCAGNGARTCLEDGSGYGSVTACEIDETCAAGSCVSSTCAPGATSCAGQQLLTCNAGGDGYDETDCAGDGLQCVVDGDTARCDSRLCEPGVSRCSDDGSQRLVCDDVGSAEEAVDCGQDEVCSAGTCQALTCAPGATRCEGDVRFVCANDGLSESSMMCGEGETCSNGTCVEEACVPQCGDRMCGVDPVCGEPCGTCSATETCNASGQCVDDTCTPSCGFQQCGVDPVCGESCGTCAASETCNVDNLCADSAPSNVLTVRLLPVVDTADFNLVMFPVSACSNETIYHGRHTADWNGNNSVADDPQMDATNTDSFGTEVITWTDFRPGTYYVAVEHNPASGNPDATTYRVDFFMGDDGVYSFVHAAGLADVVVYEMVLGADSVELTVADSYDFSLACTVPCNNDSCSGENQTCSTRAGTCVLPEDDVPQACLVDDHCDGGPQTCNADGQCEAIDVVCSDHDQCNDWKCDVDNVCKFSISCDTNADCPDETYCANFFLLKECLFGCRASDECGNGEQCNNAGDCLDDAQVLEPGDACDAGGTERCLHGHYCSFFTNTCVVEGQF